MTKTEVIEYTTELANLAGEENADEYAKGFVDRLIGRNEIVKEYLTYLNTGKLLCEYAINVYTIADIIIWQMDHFKALLDNHIAQNKGNQYKMVLGGFATMMDMEDNPQKYVAMISETTGTDFLSKY